MLIREMKTKGVVQRSHFEGAERTTYVISKERSD